MAAKSLQCLYIPDDSSPTQLAEEKELVFPTSNFDEVVCNLLKCEHRAVETIYSEEELAMLNGRSNGLPPGRHFTLFEAYMDDNGNATRPYNSLAARLFARERSYGPMIVMKMTCTKSRNGEINVVRHHTLKQSDLESPAFQNKRREYSRKKAVQSEAMMRLFTQQGGIVINLG